MLTNRIKEWREKRGWSMDELAEKCGTTAPTINKLEKSQRGLTQGWMVRLADALICTPADLMPIVLGPTKRLLVIGAVQAGLFREALEWPPEDRYEVNAPVPKAYQGLSVFCLQVVGPSMNEKFPDGSFVTCVPLMELGEAYLPEHEKFYVVYRRNEIGEVEATIKEFRVDAEGVEWLWPRSNHPSFQTPWKLADLSNGNGFDDGDQDIVLGARVIGKYEDV